LQHKYIEQNIEIPTGVFYNPNNWLDRQLLKEIYSLLSPKGFIDLTSSSGIKSLIISNIDKINPIICNDISKKAYNLYIQNKRLIAYNQDILNLRILEPQNDMLVDLDPFGSSEPYLKFLTKLNCKYFSVCFTDVINLCSIKRKTYMLKTYGISVQKTSAPQELALRIVIKKIVQEFNKVNKKVIVLLSYSRLHYLKVYFKVHKGINLESVKIVSVCPTCKILTKDCPICHKSLEIGQIYCKQLYDLEFVNKLRSNSTNLKIIKFLKPFDYIDKGNLSFKIQDYCKLFKILIPKKNLIINRLCKLGFNCYSSEFDKNTLKTNAPILKIINAIKTPSPGFEPES
jgi:tRNA G26 N,N-dimethylase Trm1